MGLTNKLIESNPDGSDMDFYFSVSEDYINIMLFGEVVKSLHYDAGDRFATEPVETGHRRDVAWWNHRLAVKACLATDDGPFQVMPMEHRWLIKRVICCWMRYDCGFAATYLSECSCPAGWIPVWSPPPPHVYPARTSRPLPFRFLARAMTSRPTRIWWHDTSAVSTTCWKSLLHR